MADQPSGHLPGRKAGATVCLDATGLTLFIERGGKSLLTWCDAERAAPAAEAVVESVRGQRRPPLHVHRIDGQPAHESPLRDTLVAAGFVLTPRGLRVREGRR